MEGRKTFKHKKKEGRRRRRINVVKESADGPQPTFTVVSLTSQP
jgi:hypothetical protein